jgi:hypothetical protein
MKQWNKNLIVLGTAILSFVAFEAAQAQVGPARTAARPAVKAELSTRAETAGMQSLRMAAENSPSLRPLIIRLEAMQTQGQLNAQSAREMATVISGLAVQMNLPKEALTNLPKESQINAAMANASNSQFSLVRSSAIDASGALGLMESLNNAAKANCDLALSRAPVSADLGADQQVLLQEASGKVESYIATKAFYGFDTTQVSRNFFDLVNSGQAGAVDIDVALGLAAIKSGAGFVEINDRMKALAVDGLDEAERKVIEQCAMAWGVEGFEAARGVDSGSRMSADVAAACSVETSGVQLTAAQVKSLCRI